MTIQSREYVTLAFAIWNNMSGEEKLATTIGRYPIAQLLAAEKQGYDIAKLREALANRAERYLTS